MSQRDSAIGPPPTRRNIFPNEWEFPDPRLAVLALLIAVALFLSGRFGSETAPVREDGAAPSAEHARPNVARGEAPASRP
jgi:hypothetical protein